MANVDLSVLRRHTPCVDEYRRVVACSCGWALVEDSEDLWLSWLEHLPGVVSGSAGKLVLTPQDQKFLASLRVKV